MTKREQDFFKSVEVMKSKAHNIYGGCDITWARKFRDFYGMTHYQMPDVPRSRFKWISQRQPIALCKDLKGEIPYKLGLGTHWIQQIDRMHEFFESNWIQEVHVDEDISIIKNLFVQCARLYKIKTIVHLHGALGQRHGFLPLTADELWVWDERQKKKLIEWGLEEHRIKVEGYSRRYGKYNPITFEAIKTDVFKYLKFDKKKPMILIAPYTFSNYGDGGDEVIQSSIHTLRRAILACAEKQIVIKLHPTSPDRKLWEDWQLQHNLVNVRIEKEYEPFHLAIASDKMLVHHSTYAIDGYVFNKDVAIIEDGFPTGVEEYGDIFKKITTKMEAIDFINAI